MKNKRSLLILTILLITFLTYSCTNKKVAPADINGNTAPDSSYVNEIEEVFNPDSTVFNIYRVELYDRNDQTDAFISVSDIYYGSGSIPPDIIKNQQKIPYQDLRYLELEDAYRKKLLSALQLRESDTLYIFDYNSATLQKTPISKLKSVAYLSYYVSEGEEIDESSYMLGFQVESGKKWENIYQKHDHSIAYFGRRNPFIENLMVPIKWKEITPTDFIDKLFSRPPSSKDKIYEFKYADLNYYLKDFTEGEDLQVRDLIVLDDKKKIFFKKTFKLNFEGREFTSLSGIQTEQEDRRNSQWTGTLFKNKPPVIFGFMSESFGCSVITLMEKAGGEIPINCDNRH